MILVDSSVWIDLLADRDTRQTRSLERFASEGRQVGIGDLVTIEVLQGIRHERDFRHAKRVLSLYDRVRIADHKVAEAAAQNYRFLRAKGITIRKTIDTLIATRCMIDDIPLLFSDRDFLPFVEHLDLRSALTSSENFDA